MLSRLRSMKKLEDLILTYKDFPKKGIDFKDVLEILQYPDIFKDLILKMSTNQFLIYLSIYLIQQRLINPGFPSFEIEASSRRN